MSGSLERGGRAGLVLAFLALNACVEEESQALAAPELLETGADVVIQGLEHVITMDGVKEGELYADTAYAYRDSSVYVMRNPTLVLFTAGEGLQRARVTADHGRYNLASREMYAQGNVVLTINEGNRRVETPQLNYDPNGDRIWSDSLTVLREEGTVSEGMGFDSDLNFRRLVVGEGSIIHTGDPGGPPGGREPSG